MENTDSRSAESQTELAKAPVPQDFKVEQFNPSHLDRIQRFSERYWTRPRTSSFYRWRYLDSLEVSRTFVAVTADECLGVLSALRKRYLIGGAEVPCLEIFDWHGLPGLKGSGVGIRVMRAMMREGVRLMGVGGTADVRKTLPAMGWQTIAQVETFELPLQGETLLPGLRERLKVNVPGQLVVLRAVASNWFWPRRRPFHGEVVEIAQPGDETEPLYRDAPYDFLQIPQADVSRWQTAGYSGVGAFRYWYFVVGGVLRGWVMTRVYETDQGREAAILDLYASDPNEELYAWMISEAAVALAASRVRIIRGRATCPIVQAAFRSNRFRNGEPLPVHTWPKLAPEHTRLHITLNHGDAPFRPLPSPKSATAFLID